MDKAYIDKIAQELGLTPGQTASVLDLLADGSTVPFIARYRKEATGSLDEVAITAIRDRHRQLLELEDRRQAILQSLEKNGHLTQELEAKIREADSMATLEDIYLPYRPKRRTKATVAREKGLEPLAETIYKQRGVDPETEAENYLDDDKGVTTIDEALQGARHIIAEWINEHEAARAALRELFQKKAILSSKVIAGRENQGKKFKDYFQWEEPAAGAPSHRILAIRRGEQEDILSMNIQPPEDLAQAILTKMFVKSDGPDSRQVELAAIDAYKRLMSRSLETEMRLETKKRADREAIAVFAENLRHLLLAPPLGAKRVLAIDPGYRTGCKIVCLDRQGKLLDYDTIYPHGSENRLRQAEQTITKMYKRWAVEAIAVGNGTAGRETMAFIHKIGLNGVTVVMVDESGASIYSASDTAREEFPDLDLTFRGAVSIGRRLMDPLAELVKIDPKSIGVGQYQHDVDQAALKAALDDVVISCVNAVGVDVNQASIQLLTYVSGLGPRLARNIVAWRNSNGRFKNRRQLLEVPRLGPKAFQQAAGFLRIKDGENPLDASAVHPESYSIVEAMAKDLDCTVQDLLSNTDLRQQIKIKRYMSDSVGLPTLQDILEELAKPGRDPRDSFEEFSFAEHVNDIADLSAGMELPGIVTNVTRFGAFVDIGVHQDGLVHVSQLANRFIKDPAEVVKVHQKVKVTVMEVDLERQRISLSMKTGRPSVSQREKPAAGNARPAKPSQVFKPKGHRNSQGRKPKSRINKPFNNPFADLIDKIS